MADPGASPAVASNPGSAPTAVADPGTSPAVASNPGSAPTAVADPGASPGAASNPGSAPTAVANPGTSPGIASNPGSAPAAVADPGASPGAATLPTAPTVVADPGPEPANTPMPGDAPALVQDPGGAPAVVEVPSPGSMPNVIVDTVYVGSRIRSPYDDGVVHPAGYINEKWSNSFDPGAYINPFVAGFDAARQGAVIPVNAIPGKNVMEVWWFTTNAPTAGMNAGKKDLGFQTIYWPRGYGRYTVQWPVNGREIVLASNVGSGTLDPLESLGAIYRQPDPAKPGYNPNEEHALMSGGMAFALRNDLNVTTTTGYTSDPFVLVSWTDGEGRPSMSAFKVLREKPSAGYVFDYVVSAGRVLQPPMPLPLLGKPVDGSGSGASFYNVEVPQATLDLPTGWNATYAASRQFGHYDSFTWADRQNNTWVYRGPHKGLEPLQAGKYNVASNRFDALTAATARAGKLLEYYVHASRQDEYLSLAALDPLPTWLEIRGLKLVGMPFSSHVKAATSYRLVVMDLYTQERVTNTLNLTVLSASGSITTQAQLALTATNASSGTSVTFTDRPPFLGVTANGTNSFRMKYYYKTRAGFDWVGRWQDPGEGAIVPYLLPDPAWGSGVMSPTTPSLEVVYRPVWPERDPSDATSPVPAMSYGMTLTEPRLGLPGVRSMKTAQVLYQQSLAASLPLGRTSVVLHDGTREKVSDLATAGLADVPGGVATTLYRGLYYFPLVPPHIGTRLFFDKNRGTKGRLVLRGEYRKEELGLSYLVLNVLRDADLAAVKGLCPASDPAKGKWDALVEGLATPVETFWESANVPGTYVANPDWTVTTGVGDLVEVGDANTAVDSYALSATGPGTGFVTLVESSGTAFTKPGDPVAMHVLRVTGSKMDTGEVKILPADNPLSEAVSFQHTADLAGREAQFEYEWRIASPVDGQPPVTDADMTNYLLLAKLTGIPRQVIGGPDLRSLCDNYVVMRYRAKDAAHPLYNAWSDWTEPKLVEGWIKRVLAGINPFNQRVKDLFNNPVNTDSSILTQAGRRWEGAVALNMDTINNYGLIEIYETVLRRGRMLSIESGINYGPANDALLLVAGYLRDLYEMLGDEAWADAANPTIGIGTKDRAYGEVATALFSFKGQMASLLDEELALLRGRDDFLVPGVRVAPVYNRLVWNYTRGIDSGEVVYALNYNIQPANGNTGTIGASDAAKMFPQGHGDAYGHYLTAMKGYYSLLLNSKFDWVPRTEAVNVLGQPVSVDYMDERKFAASASALAKAGRQVFDLTWRKEYASVTSDGWAGFAASRTNNLRTYAVGLTNANTVRHWSMDHWAARTMQGALVNWVVGNAMLPDTDPNPLHEGIQKVDRTAVPELGALAVEAAGLQAALDRAEGGLSPLGVPEGTVSFDINPSAVVGTDNGTHFEQIYQRARQTLNNAVASFDDAKDVTRLMRSEQDSLAEVQAGIARQELAYNNALIEIYGTPYTDDIGPGKTWKQGYAGPDLVHYMYADSSELALGTLSNPNVIREFKIDIQDYPEGYWQGTGITSEAGLFGIAQTKFRLVARMARANGLDSYLENEDFVRFTLDSNGMWAKPAGWTGRRASPGKAQESIRRYMLARSRAEQALVAHTALKHRLDRISDLFLSLAERGDAIMGLTEKQGTIKVVKATAELAMTVADLVGDTAKEEIESSSDTVKESIPMVYIVGMAMGGDTTSAVRSLVEKVKGIAKAAVDFIKSQPKLMEKVTALNSAIDEMKIEVTRLSIEQAFEAKQQVVELERAIDDLHASVFAINQALIEMDGAANEYRARLAEGDRIQEERLLFRQRSAGVIQGFRTRDAAFRLFRNEKLERFKTLFDLAAQYALVAANAYDYETGLLGTTAGRSFVARIISSRALGVVRGGEPQYAGSDMGDPGLSSCLAEMKADWDVLRGRLGFNNPDAYGTTVSLRTEAMRILPTADGDGMWQDVLRGALQANILEDADVRRYCMQVDTAGGLPVPGIVLTFTTTIADGYNLFGNPLAGGDHTFTPSSFATKIFGVGVALEGYRGMSQPSANGGTVSGAGATSPGDPNVTSLDPLALAATPYVYLIPVGVDSMRSPPLGDAGGIRTWSVQDVAIPMPFNLGASDFSSKKLWQSSDSLTEPLYAVRKHQAFRPVASEAVFSPSLYGQGGTLMRSQFTNNRLVGRSVWNSQWKLVIPGKTLLNNPNQGLDRFVQTVNDIKLHFATYSYSGN